VSEQQLVQSFVDRFRDRHTITVATGATCAYLGDERNLREYLIADEVVRALKSKGHIVQFLCFNDDLDPLNHRQLRVAVNKDPNLVAKFEPFCGRPISDIRWSNSSEVSWSEHFQQEFVKRLNALGCNPNVISVSKMYERGLYAPFVKQTLLHQERVREYLAANFPSYHPEKLFWPICPTCGYIDDASVEAVNPEGVEIACNRCLMRTRVSFEELRGKLNWKLDCAARWAMMRVDIEPFTKAYLEPHTGSFYVAQALSKTFFGGTDVTPIPYGMVTMPNSLGGKILECLPASVVRSLFIRNVKSDLDISEERIATEANKVEVLPDLTFADMVRQLLPAWLLDATELTPDQREFMVKGLAYSRHFEPREVKPYLCNRGHLEGISIDILKQIQSVIQQVILLRKAFGLDYDAFVGPAKAAIERLGDQRRQVTAEFRKIVGQERGVPNSRFLYLLPITYLMNLESMIDLYIASKAPLLTHAVIRDTDEAPPLRIVAGDRFAYES
jgi:hypothetical protein